MPIEMQCGACSGVFLADQPGAIVACPHCGGHLQVPHFASEGGISEQTPVEAPAADQPGSVPSVTFAPSMPTLSPSSYTNDPSTDLLPDQQPKPMEPPTEAIPQAETARRLAEAAASTLSDQVPPTVPHSGPQTWVESTTRIDSAAFQEMPTLSANRPVLPDPPNPGKLEETAPFFTLGTPPAPKPAPATVAQPASANHENPATGTSGEPPVLKSPSDMVPKAWFHIALSLASAFGITTLYLGWSVYRQAWTVHQLESLPDKAPPKPRGGDKNAKITLIRVPFEATMPKRHTLRVGESERYGDVRVTVLGVTRGPIAFSHYDAADKTVRPPSGPALKLRLKVENVGDEPFVPFDKELVYDREPDPKNYELLWANNFVCSVANKTKVGPRVLMYDLPLSGAWDLAGQNCGRELAPHESLETYLATEETDEATLKGDLIWRVHFRKGHNKQSGRGVTTLIEVAFRDDQIEPDPVAPPTAPPAAPPDATAPPAAKAS